jgi:Tfp pilus assembly protein PilF
MDRIEKLQQFLAQNPGDSFLCHALALEYVSAGNDVKARELFEQLLSNDPGYVGSYYHLGKLLERAGEQESAIKTYEKGMDAAKQGRDNHSYNELKSAYEELVN